MFKKPDLSILKPFLSFEQLKWGDSIRFHDDVLTMADDPNAVECFRYLLEDLRHCPGRPLAFWSTGRCFSPARCGEFLKRLGGMQGPDRASQCGPASASGTAMAREENVFVGLIRWLREVKRPVIMVFQGDVLLSFLGIGLACDQRIATSDTTFHNQERDCDMPPGAGLLYLLPAYVGLGRANKLVTRTAEMSSYSAFKLGLLDEVVEPSELDRAVATMAEEVSCLSAETLGTIKQLLNYRLPDFDSFFTLESQGLNRALRGRPWEKLREGTKPEEPGSRPCD
jgi:enoyl-CoA hydratase/carnithine racemase